jgi:hypothetical protein
MPALHIKRPVSRRFSAQTDADVLAGSLGTGRAPVSVEEMSKGAKAALARAGRHAYARHHHCEVSTFDQALIRKFTEVTAAEPPKPKAK